MGRCLALAAILFCLALRSFAQAFAVPGAPEPVNAADVEHQLAGDGAAVELLISFGTSRGGSA